MHLRFVAVALILSVTAGCATRAPLGPDATAVSVQSELPPPDVEVAGASQREFRIGAFDTIAVRVFGAEDLDREGMVDASGTFAMPLIGNVDAAGRTTGELAAVIADRLRGRYLRDPQVTVAVREIRSQRVTIDGAVRQPGTYPVVGRMTLQEAIATARGADEFAHLNHIVVFRTVNEQPMAALFSLADIRAGRYPDPEIYGNDMIVVGENRGRRIFRDILQTIPMFGVFTPLVR